jgi:hypothetical protein
VPLTRATTTSDADEDLDAPEDEDESFEQPETAGSTSSASAAIVATVAARGKRLRVEPGAKFNERDLSGVDLCGVALSRVMARSLESAAALPIGGGGHSRNRFPFAMAEIGPILTIK